jgi:hypothetical protein
LAFVGVLLRVEGAMSCDFLGGERDIVVAAIVVFLLGLSVFFFNS